VRTLLEVLDAGSAAAAIGDVVCLAGKSSETVTRALAATLAASGMAYGICVSAASTGGAPCIAIQGHIPPAITGLPTAGNQLYARVNTATARVETVATLGAADYPLGTVDAAGNLTLRPQFPLNAGGAAPTVFYQHVEANGGGAVTQRDLTNFTAGTGISVTATDVGGVTTVNVTNTAPAVADTDFYQTVELNAAAFAPQRPALNLKSGQGITLTGADNPGNSSSDTTIASAIVVEQNGTVVTNSGITTNFTGAGVAVSNVGGVATVNIPGAFPPAYGELVNSGSGGGIVINNSGLLHMNGFWTGGSGTHQNVTLNSGNGTITVTNAGDYRLSASFVPLQSSGSGSLGVQFDINNGGHFINNVVAMGIDTTGKQIIVIDDYATLLAGDVVQLDVQQNIAASITLNGIGSFLVQRVG
jgi:hypothetical protein